MNKYLGPKRLPKLSYPYRREFQEPALYHDTAYELGSNRRRIDKMFLDRCLDKCDGQTPLKKASMTIVAIIYYILVRLFGWISFYLLK